MGVISKFREKGVAGLYRFVYYKGIRILNLVTSKLYTFQRIDANSIVLESEGDCCDNAYALFDYMNRNGYIGKYRITWLVDHPENFHETKNVRYCYKRISAAYHPKTIKALRTCKWFIYDHGNVMASLGKRPGQNNIYLSHGWGYKASKGSSKMDYDFITVTGPISAEGMSAYWNESVDKAIITGYPRLDYLFQEDSDVDRTVQEKWKFGKYQKVLFWMPTFRKSVNSELSEDYCVNETGLPIFNTKEDLYAFDAFLNKANVLMVFKLHHLQAELEVFKETFQNIILVRDEELQEAKIQLYQLVRYADVMISDYSSIAIDYLIMNRPLVFTLDDYEQYAASRGLFPENAVDYMPGYHVTTKNELVEAVQELIEGNDYHLENRQKVIEGYHTYLDGNSSKRVLDRFGILKSS